MNKQKKYNLSLLILSGLGLFCSIAMLSACAGNVKKPDIADASFVDSFYIDHYSSLTETINIHFTSDSELLSCDNEARKLIRYKRDAGNFFKPVNSHKIPERESIGQIQSFGKLANNMYIISDYNYNWFISDGEKKTKQLITDKRLENDVPSILKNNPLIITKDSSLILHCFYKRFENYKDYFSQKVLSKYKIINDTLKYIDSYVKKPDNLSNFKISLTLFTYVADNKTAYIIHSPLDSIYVYNIESNTLKTHSIHNAFYTLPAKYNYDSGMTSNAMQYNYNYDSKNFQYQAIYYNPRSKHFILFFTAPELMKTDYYHNIAGVVLDKDLKTLKYLYFTNNKIFFYPTNYIQMPSGNLGMLIYDNNNSIKRENIKVMVLDY